MDFSIINKLLDGKHIDIIKKERNNNIFSNQWAKSWNNIKLGIAKQLKSKRKSCQAKIMQNTVY